MNQLPIDVQWLIWKTIYTNCIKDLHEHTIDFYDRHCQHYNEQVFDIFRSQESLLQCYDDYKRDVIILNKNPNNKKRVKKIRKAIGKCQNDYNDLELKARMLKKMVNVVHRLKCCCE